MFHWVFENFAALFGSAPEVIFMDSDKEMVKAIKAEWPNTKQFLCTWHLYKNFYEHFRSLFAGKKKKSKWNEVCNLFWQLCKLSDVTGQLTFDSHMDVLTNIISPLIESSDCTQKKKQGDHDFLAALREQKQQWAACYTWLHTTYGIHSMQRAETVNSAIKHFCSKNSKIVDLVNNLEQMSSRHHLKTEVESLCHIFCTNAGNRANIHPSAKAVAAVIEGYAAAIVEAQAGQISLYRTIEDSPVPDLSHVNGWKPFLQDETVYCVVISNPQSYTDDESARRDADYGIGNSIELTSPLEDSWEFEELHKQLAGSTSQQQGGSTIQTKHRAPLRHWASVRWCMCLFQYCYGLPCRHQFHVMLRENYFGAIEYDFFWKKMTAEDRETRAAGGGGRASPVLFLSSTQLDFGSTAEERLPQLQTAASNFVKYASQSPALTKQAHEIMLSFCGKDKSISVKNAPLVKKQNDPRFQSADPTNPGNKGAKKRKRAIANQKRKWQKQAAKNCFTGK
jgi:MULE transposase domain